MKKAYNIVGFDCANCAAKAEAHLNTNPHISYARIDFAANRLYLNFANEELSIEEIKSIIAEVESDPLDISEASLNFAKKKLWNKSMTILLIRVVFCIFTILINTLILHEESQYWLRFALYLISVLVISYDIFYKVINKIIHKQNPVDEYLLISIAAIGAFVLASVNKEEPTIFGPFMFEEHIEAIMVVLLFQIGRIVESFATNKSKDAVMSAMDLRAEFANLITDNEIKKVKPEELKIDDIILIKKGEIIPIDGVIIDGEAFVDKSSLTGEYVPVRVNTNDQVSSGCLLKEGTIKIKVNTEYKDSTVAKILELISNSGERKSKADKFITKFAKYYTPAVCIASVLYILIAGLVTKNWSSSVYKGLEILVVSCPCAIVISVPMAYFSAIGLASKNGIVIKGTNYFDELTKLKLLVTDKTGTLTHGSFSIQKIKAIDDEDELMITLYAAECLSNHPIGKTICHGINTRKMSAEQEQFEEVLGKGVSTYYHGSHLLAGSDSYMDENGITYEKANENGIIVYAAKNGKCLGYVVLADEIKQDAQPMVDLLHSEGIEILLLTGDKEANAMQICTQLGIDRWRSELLPEQKTVILEEEINKTNRSVAFVGDGINDAPSIIRSDIGIAMGGIGSDAAVENADIVIMNDDPAKIYDAYKISKMARNRAIFNIIFSLFIKIGVMILLMIIPNVMMEIAVLADTGLTVLMVINSWLLLYKKVKRPI